jgi:hypothetical protein
MPTEYWWGETWKTMELWRQQYHWSYQDMLCGYWTEIAQACPNGGFSISNVKPSGYATIVLISFSLTNLTWRFKTLGQRKKFNSTLCFITTHDKNCSHIRISLVWREEYLFQSISAELASKYENNSCVAVSNKI